ncbi:MAG: transposase [Rickettsia endosymbiont of Ixodes persulcatus]|nr:transposase [Rickettsia endosymbiont of Ixodes persulcatus]
MARWSIEFYHRELKQTCGIERCQARTGRAQRNHICLAVFDCKNDLYKSLLHFDLSILTKTLFF